MSKRVLMVAAENDALPGAKVGGVGDVIRDLPKALVAAGMTVDVIIPSYGFLSRLPNLQLKGRCSVFFQGQIQEVSLYKVLDSNSPVSNYIVHHADFSAKGETVYCNDPDSRPFASDATKFAFFCLAVAQIIKDEILPFPDILHCHDWHTAYLLILRKYVNTFKVLQKFRTIFTVHNLAMQGVRPISGDESSLLAWYPYLTYDEKIISDPDAKHCINPMRAAILLADKVHTVSPTYAQEIQGQSDIDKGIYGGERLELDLRRRASENALVGILNGCEYSEVQRYVKPSRKNIFDLAIRTNIKWATGNRNLRVSHWLAESRLNNWLKNKDEHFTVTLVGRITDQKVRLLCTRVADGKTTLEHILDNLSQINTENRLKGMLIILGSGAESYENTLVSIAGHYENFIFLNGYSDALSQLLYQYGDLFLMPSSYEPCGISQMLAMRAGQPCLVNGVGGLKDTVTDKVNGFVFTGIDIADQAEKMIDHFNEAVRTFTNNKSLWTAICRAASESRFTWSNSAKQYISLLYSK